MDKPAQVMFVSGYGGGRSPLWTMLGSSLVSIEPAPVSKS